MVNEDRENNPREKNVRFRIQVPPHIIHGKKANSSKIVTMSLSQHLFPVALLVCPERRKGSDHTGGKALGLETSRELSPHICYCSKRNPLSNMPAHTGASSRVTPSH